MNLRQIVVTFVPVDSREVVIERGERLIVGGTGLIERSYVVVV
jgi:hypothetical protein